LVELGEVSSVPARTIRFYTAKGLLLPPLVGGSLMSPIPIGGAHALILVLSYSQARYGFGNPNINHD